ncbi:hypothetical protein PQR53_34760 [Paraburkholderia fungorum]|uniref:hypothetical protein n=1 Tax=Paraburkholderia fungorum TaxID=134537 RepID=UPI0038B8B3BD
MKSQQASECGLHQFPSRAPMRSLLLFLLLVPTLLFYSKLASSMALGTALVACIAIFVLVLLDPPVRVRARAFKWITIIVGVITVHAVVASAFTPIDYPKALGSLFILIICLAGSAAMADLLAASTTDELVKAARLCLAVFWLVGMLGCAGLAQVASGDYPKPVFPFTEPSHLAVTVAPLLIFGCVTSGGMRRVFYIGSFLIIAAVLQNVTLVAACLIAAAVCIPLRYIFVLLLAGTPLLLNADLSYYLDRLDFSDQNQNLSALVFVQGWQFIAEAWTRTHGIGYGFQQLGTTESGSAAGYLIYAILGQNLNVFDGGFTLSKLVSEGGLLGLLLATLYAIKAATAIVFLRSVARAKRKADILQVFSASVIAGYLLEMFIRGSGYFTPVGLLLISAIWIEQSARARTLRSPSNCPNNIQEKY